LSDFYISDASMRDLASDEDRIEHSRQDKISDKMTLASQQPAILTARHGTSYEAG